MVIRSTVIRRYSPSDDAGWPASRWMVELLTGDGCHWFSRHAWPEPADVAAQMVVLVHGVVVSSAYFQPVADLIDRRFRVLVPDLPGTGSSDSYRGRLSLEELGESLIWWLDRQEVSAAVLVGNSMGCQVITRVAAERPDLTAALVLVSPTMDPAIRTRFGAMARGMRDLPREDVGLWPIWARDLFRADPIAALAALEDAILDPQLERAARVQIPVHVVGGECDPIAPPQWVRNLATAFPSGTSTVIKGAPHAINYSNPNVLAEVIRMVTDGEPLPREMHAVT